MSQPTRNTDTASATTSRQQNQSEMMQKYLAGGSMVADRLMSGTIMTDQALHDSLVRKAAQLDELVRQSQGSSPRSGST